MRPAFAPHLPWLAPLAGYSDLPFRLLCREYGAAVCETEMVSAKGLMYRNARTPELLKTLPEDQPLVVQLFGAEPECLGQAVASLREQGYLWFDCNMGCSVRKVMRQGAGAALLGDLDRALAVARAMLAASQGGGVGFKLRLGLDGGRPVLPDLALRLEDAGAAWLALHPRYASQGFGGQAQWAELQKLAPRLGIPLLASGDLFSAGDGRACLDQTGATGLMYARGALHDPAIFARHRLLWGGEAPADLSLRRLIRRHVALARQYGHPKRSFARMRSLLPRYARGFAGVAELRRELCLCQDWTALWEVLDKCLPAA